MTWFSELLLIHVLLTASFNIFKSQAMTTVFAVLYSVIFLFCFDGLLCYISRCSLIMSTKCIIIYKCKYHIFRITCFSKLTTLSCSCKYLFPCSPQDLEETPSCFISTPPQNSSKQVKRKRSLSIAAGDLTSNMRAWRNFHGDARCLRRKWRWRLIPVLHRDFLRWGEGEIRWNFFQRLGWGGKRYLEEYEKVPN